MHQLICPDCDQTIEVDKEKIDVGDIVECNYCGAEMEVLQKEPLEVEKLVEEK